MDRIKQLQKEVNQLQKSYDNSVTRSVYHIGKRLRAKQEELKEATIVELSKEFAKVLKSWLSRAQIAEVIATNAEDIKNDMCASHNFCDANMAMNEAFETVLEREIVFYNSDDPETEDQYNADADLWSKA
ncbi:MAG TPA: hypothetical protein VN698_13875, partial [Bacteroidia bacterium]|nr:hypothetical protein [Bacteroidia bacterium]